MRFARNKTDPSEHNFRNQKSFQTQRKQCCAPSLDERSFRWRIWKHAGFERLETDVFYTPHSSMDLGDMETDKKAQRQQLVNIPIPHSLPPTNSSPQFYCNGYRLYCN